VYGSNTVYVAVPIIDAAGNSASNSESQQTVQLSTVKDGTFSALVALNTATPPTTMPLSVLNILDDITNGKFY
jgi:hypothetical protein